MDENQNNQDQELVQNNSKNKAISKTSKAINSEVKKVVSSSAKKSLAVSAAPIIAALGVAAIMLIIISGIATFLITMPGIAMASIKQFAKDLGNSIASFFGRDSVTFVEDDKIYEVLDYMEEMEYDLKGYGFLTEYADRDSNGDLLDDKDDGVIRYKTDDDKDGKIKEAQSDYIFTYLVSDNYMYTVKNFNLDTQDGNGTHWYENLWTTIKGIGARTFGRIINGVTLGVVNNFEGEMWGKGMIAIYYDNGLGVQGDFYGNGLRNNWRNIFKWPPEWPIEFNSIKMDAQKKTLTIQKGVLGDEIKYNMEGWAGRYGMPLEFLLSVHFGTMMPDLAFDMAETFPTEVKILLHRKNAEVDTYVPYISEVKNHWYRDTYFVMDESKDVVQTDTEYEDLKKERWTLYETYEDGDLQGEYKLYLIDSKGQYATSTSAIRNYSKASSKIEHDSSNGYYLFKGTQSEATDLELDVVKKAKLIKYDSNTFSDIGWNEVGSVWTAYELGENGSFKQTGEGLRAETNPTIKQLFLYNTYFRYDGTSDVADVIYKFRKENSIELGSLDNKYDLSENKDVLKNTKTKIKSEDGSEREYSIEDVSGKVTLNQDSLNIFSMLDNMNTLDTDYIYRDFKELAVEFGYFTKEELIEERARLLAWPVYDTGSFGYPKREIDKNDFEFGTMIHSKGDIEAIKELGLAKAIASIEEEEDVGNQFDFDSFLDTLDEEERRQVEEETSRRSEALESGTTKNLRTNQEVGSSVGAASHAVYTEPHAEPNHRNIEHVESLETADEGYIDIIEDNGVEYKHFLQAQGPYANSSYGDPGTMSNSGCGPTSVTNLLTGYGFDITPDDIREKTMSKYGHAMSPTEMFEFYDFKNECLMAKSEKEFAEALIEAFNDGKPVVALMNPCPPSPDTFWTVVGHYACLIGIDENGKMITADPASMKPERITCENGIDDIIPYLIALWIPEEPPSSFQKEGKPYEGYLGNEAVVSPVTGVLLEYGTYSTDEKDERMNVDLKYGHTSLKESAGKEVKDKVGYAKIMVLDVDNYRKLESISGSYWRSQSKSLISKDKGQTKIIDDSSLKSTKDLKDKEKWTTLNKTVYGYKEFLEKYEAEGISGDIVFIDGFVCEDVDEDLEKTLDKSRKKVAKEIPNGTGITFNKFKVSKDDLDNDDKTRPSQYISEKDYKSLSKSVTDRLKAENKIKKDAASSIAISSSGDDLVFIKEGTVLGRTMTDKELLEGSKLRKGQYGTYEEMRESKDQDGNPIYNIIGNYLRIIFRDKDDSVIENVEDYLKLDEGKQKKQIDINDFLLYYWSPYEAGGWDKPKCGPEQAEDHRNGTSEISTGICQWTNDTKENAEIYKLISFAGQYDSKFSGMESLRGTLQGVPGSVSASSAVSEMQSVISGYCRDNRDEFLEMEVELGKYQWLDKDLSDLELEGEMGQRTYELFPWISEREMVVQGSVMSYLIRVGSNMESLHNAGVSITQDMTDEDIISYDTMSKIFKNDGDRAKLQSTLAKAILDGEITEDDVETWVREGSLDGHPEFGSR